jgi:hypothetical protein
MTKKLLVLVDLGHFKAYRLEESRHFSHPRLELLENWDTDANERLSEQVSDQAGQFPKGSRSFAAVNDMSNGERHNLELERRRRAMKSMVKRIGELLESDGFEGCYFAAAANINNSVLNEMTPQVRNKIQKNVTANLTRLNAPEILNHFCAPATT